LSLGQGTELLWARDPKPMGMQEVLQIFRQKTAPAFEVALHLGVLLSGADADVASILTKYSEALGIAYQIRDDLEDLEPSYISGVGSTFLGATSPSLPFAVAMDRARGESRGVIERFWKRSPEPGDQEKIAAILGEVKAEDRCRGLLEAYKEEAVRSLKDIEHASLKGLLRRVISKIFSVEIKGWCSEFEARNAAGGQARAENAR
jgi:geranylgeranyl diphosphate synthase type II